MQPKVSIVIPCFNRGKFIRETLACVQKINYPNFECIIVDNSSNDDSVKIITEFINTDTRFILLTEVLNNVANSRNVAIRSSTGTYILPLDSDDLIHPNYITEAVDILENHPHVSVVTCDARFFGAKSGKWKLPDFDFQAFIINNSIHNSSLFRKADFDTVGGYKPELIVRQDWEFWINILKQGGEVWQIKKTYFYYRKHPESIQQQYKHASEVDDAFRSIYRHHNELYASILSNPIVILKQLKKYKRAYNLLRKITFRKPV